MKPMRADLWPTFFVVLLAAMLCSGCGSNAPAGGGPESICASTPAGNVEISSAASDGSVSGCYVPAAGGTAVAFTVTASLGTGSSEARYTSSASTLTSRIVGDSSGTVLSTGLDIDGIGAVTAAEQTALAQLASGDLATAIAMVPLELGCRGGVDRVQLAALLMPWQMVLKYLDADRVNTVKALAAHASCTYFQDIALRGGTYPSGDLGLANDDPVPSVFGIFPLDGDGASELSPQALPLVGDPVGPCGALCRGACGPDCPTNNCVRSEKRVCQVDANSRFTGTSWFEVAQRCGIHQGCVEHDQCYDDCNESHGCSSWGAAICRRGCDRMAIAAWGLSKTDSWRAGGGPYDSQVNFVFVDVDPMSSDGEHCPVGAQPDAGAAGDAGTSTPDGGSQPLFEVRPTSLRFSTPQGVAPPAQGVQLFNRSGSAVTYMVSDGTFWLREEPLSGVLGTSGTSFQAIVSAGGLPSGSYSDTITVAVEGSSPLTVSVSLTVRGDGGVLEGGAPDGPADSGMVTEGGMTADGSSPLCCCMFISEHYCANCVGCPQGLCIGGQCLSPCWTCVTAAASMSGWLCGTSCNAQPSDRCDVACP